MDRLPEANRMPFKTTAEMLIEEGQAEGRIQERIEIARSMRREGVPDEVILRVTGLDTIPDD